MSSIDGDTNSANNDYGQYDDLEAALVIAAADADARNHVQTEEEKEDVNEVKQEYKESLGYYQTDDQKTELKRPNLKKSLPEEEEDVGNIKILLFSVVFHKLPS